MALSHGALNELRSELTELRRSRGVIDARIQGIELILSARHAPRPPQMTAVSGPHLDSRMGPVVKAPKQSSLRSKVLEILQRAPGSKSADVAQQVQEEGFQIGGVTSLRNRVSHEISRLRRLGSIRKTRGGLYVVAEGQRTARQMERDAPAADEHNDAPRAMRR